MDYNHSNSILLESEEKKDIILYYTGDISQKIIENLGGVIRQRLEIETSSFLMQKIFSVFIEQTQNILFYSAEKHTYPGVNQNFGKGVTLLGKSRDNKYFLLAGNLITNTQREELKIKLNDIRHMDKKEIKKRYIEILTCGIDSNPLKGGVGLLEVAKRASEPLEYWFEKIDNDYSYYYIKAIITDISK